ncbi:hypothetical protein SVA_2589 [Sulfurifustis variabilis]|uniref:Uncharacterized protein n=1 Tax=Sulfurifustis variabilis TaxID=1675686 RepID=A0A1B4VEN0_9GAMM|nr:hypothetical protein SVA_2589 [Sulfurifustis variabilis]
MTHDPVGGAEKRICALDRLIFCNRCARGCRGQSLAGNKVRSRLLAMREARIRAPTDINHR